MARKLSKKLYPIWPWLSVFGKAHDIAKLVCLDPYQIINNACQKSILMAA